MATQDLKPSFSNLQLELLKLYANGISDEQLVEACERIKVAVATLK